ncbi:MAG TPA: 4Fe-4S binding protein, partial [Candidatus Cloacimonadota bacterium]|nr:4Fe-4S binding protein [Candidatus Cloacimonadota bacterium]
VTRNYLMRWDLDRCVGCQIGPIVCPKGALTHVEAELQDGRIVKRASVDVDEKKCVNCGMCADICPTGAIFDPLKEIRAQKKAEAKAKAEAAKQNQEDK